MKETFMKGKKSTKILAVLAAVMSLAFIACSNPNSADDEDLGGGNANNESQDNGTLAISASPVDCSFNVELGEISSNNYRIYSQRMSEGFVWNSDAYVELRNTWYSQTIEGTYQDRGTLSATELKRFLIQNGKNEMEADGTVSSAAYGNELTVLYTDQSFQRMTWVYIERVDESGAEAR